MKQLLGRVLAMGLCALTLSNLAESAVVNRRASRFDRMIRPSPSGSVGIVAEAPEALPSDGGQQAGWTAFKATNGAGWEVWQDRRSGAPLLVQGPGISWFDAGSQIQIRDAETKARQFLQSNERLFMVDGAQLVLNKDASAAIDNDHLILRFDRVVDGIKVEGQQFVFYVTRGRLVAFGANSWGSIWQAPPTRVDEATARQLLYTYLGLNPEDVVTDRVAPERRLIPTTTTPRENGPYRGVVGGGTQYRLVWRFDLQLPAEPGVWSGSVDAQTGAIVSFVDETKYTRVQGGVYPVSNDQMPPDGIEQAGWPMPYCDVANGTSGTFADSMGTFSAAQLGGGGTTELSGQYVDTQDYCGTIGQSMTCDDHLELSGGPGTDCAIPAGMSAGDTHASRSSFYHLNRVAEKGRAWLPTNTWLQLRLRAYVNEPFTCNALWDFSNVHFYQSGDGCRNTGEIAGVAVHEWGHGLDQNDGGGFDNPTEAYADVTAMISTRVSCVGRGFYETGTCSGYGDPCVSCTGIRDHDWNMHGSHSPATPAGFVAAHCGPGDSPCGREQHCEAHVAGEALWDLAARDLPAAGFDSATAWQLVEKLWYESRQGSGGNAYDCALPISDGCSVNSWFNELRVVDDDDGDLSNGTPHAAAIFAAFDRHKIACGASTDASNQNATSCPVLVSPTLTASPKVGAVTLAWTAVPGASEYRILRNDQGCGTTSTTIASVPASSTSYVANVPAGVTTYYTVQAGTPNSACESAPSNCAAATPSTTFKLLRYSFDGSDIGRDDTGNAHEGINLPYPNLIDGKCGNALFFYGDNLANEFYTPNTPDLDLTGAMSATAWIRPEGSHSAGLAPCARRKERS